jgi:transcription-repair coupling factor (superfamily II helicase)
VTTKQLAEHLYQSDPFRKVLKKLEEGDSVILRGVAGALEAFVVAMPMLALHRTCVLVHPDGDRADEIVEDLENILGEGQVVWWPSPPRHARAVVSPYDRGRQQEVLLRLGEGKPLCGVCSAQCLAENVPSPDAFSRGVVELVVGMEKDRDRLISELSRGKYAREAMVEGMGEFAVRGMIVDVFPYGREMPVRIEFFDDGVESLREFDPRTQASVRELRGVRISAPGDGGKGHLWDHLPKDAVVVIQEPSVCQGVWDEIAENVKGVSGEVIEEGLSNFQRIQVMPGGRGMNLGGASVDSFLGKMDLAVERLQHYRRQGLQPLIFSEYAESASRLEDIFLDHGLPDGTVRFVQGVLHGGFVHESSGVAVLTEPEIFGRRRRRRVRMRFKNVLPIPGVEALKRGDYVVHVDYGIGRYLGLEKIKVRGKERETLKIEYRNRVILYVRLENLGLVQKYSGREGFVPPLSRIGGREWKEIRRKTSKSLRDMAKELLRLYAKRRTVAGHAYASDTPWQREMEATFPWEETPDQLEAVRVTKGDMENSVPMDRLICGDVGFGKTEVAVRAAFKAVIEGMQVAVLVPTTILAQQHLATFRERLGRYPVVIEVLSRFRTPKQQKEIVADLAAGKIDIVIGTHRLLSKDVEFRRLGLLIIDEEHRFGVAHKEKIKSQRASVDVLTLTATPIPRTLHMALMGARDMSQIDTPPENRYPIDTVLHPWDDRLVGQALHREIERGGQVYVVHNRVQSIDSMQRLLERLAPDLRYAVAHGQMDERDLEQVMLDFLNRKVDCLVSTMIIESGLDIPNVNTMIVNRADRFGLAQLYQLRGRIGRSDRKAYAYLMIPPRMQLTRTARRRLATIAEFSSLGAGFQIAMRDLEIRGAGNLLGREQSGYINSVGYELYTQLLQQAVEEVKAEATGLEVAKEEGDGVPRLEFAADAFFPDDYMEDGGQRVEYYRRLFKAETYQQVHEIAGEVRDRFGRIPQEGRNLLGLVELRLLAREAGIGVAKLSSRALSMEFDVDKLPAEHRGEALSERVRYIMRKAGDFRLEFRGRDGLGVRVLMDHGMDWDEVMGRAKKFLHCLID